jgi:predicted cupin superfamily sugar epimerase
MDPRAAELIQLLRLQPHPEGGYFREVFRSVARVKPNDGRAERDAVTTIYFLLTRGTHSRWHRVRSDEVWHLYEGGPLEIFVAPPAGDAIERVELSAAREDAGPVHVVSAGSWQAARPRGPYALAGCTVAPGFEFVDFAFLDDDPAALARLMRVDSRARDLA